MAVIVNNPYTIPCENYTHWVELLIRDEHNQPFPNIRGILIDGSGATYPIIVGEAPIQLTNIAPGFVTLSLDNAHWINETQKRAPLLVGQESPVQTWLVTNPTGYQGAPREHHRVTLGDFVVLHDDQVLPIRHCAGKLGVLNLVSDTSHVITVQGCRFITLRIGMFFDGTANNTYSAKWGKSQLNSKMVEWRQNYQASKHALAATSGSYSDIVPIHCLSEPCFDKGEELEGSAGNELTNIQKMWDLYQHLEFSSDTNSFFYAQYITGIGTDNGTEEKKAEEDIVGLASGVGQYGIVEKVNTSIDVLINNINTILDNASKIHNLPIDGFSKVELDVFGFSRGAAAARHFINIALDGVQSKFAQAFTKGCLDNQILLSSDFDWESNDNCEIMFAGLFDTVSATAEFDDANKYFQTIQIPSITWAHSDDGPHDNRNAHVRLWLNPKRVRRAVHLVANKKTEYRHNFSVNLLNKAPHFDELILFGAHSDIGGGYHSQIAYAEKREESITYNDDYWLPRLSNKLVYHDSETYTFNYKQAKEKLEQRCQAFIHKECQNGWDERDYFIDIKSSASATGSTSTLTAKVHFRQLTEGDLSRLYLRTMFGLAKFAGVPIKEEQDGQLVWNSTGDYWHQYFPVPKILSYKHTPQTVFDFERLSNNVLDIAKQGNIAQLQHILTKPETLNLFINLGLIHHSADINTILNIPSELTLTNRPHEKEGKYQREEFPCEN